MAVIVEDGTGVLNANSYGNEDGLNVYAKAIGVVLEGSKTTLLLQAMQWLDNQPFIGIKATKEQSLQWPRLNVVIDGFDYASTDIPQQLINLQYEVAVSIFAGNDPLAEQEQKVKEETIGPIKTVYMDGDDGPVQVSASISMMVDKLIDAGKGGINATVSR